MIRAHPRPTGEPVAKLLDRARERAEAVIRDPPRHTSFDEHGAVHSVQAADLTMAPEDLDAIWSPMHLERLARTYWKYLSRVTLGLIRVAYTPTERYVVLFSRPFVLLRFRAPEYTMDDRRGVVRWRIRDGILVASEGHEGDGYLEIEIARMPSSWRGRSSTTPITSLTSLSLRSAISRTVCSSGRSRSSRSAKRSPTAIFSMYTIGPGSNIAPRSASAITEIAFGLPNAHRRVPSSGSTAMSTCGGLPSPITSPLWSIGASSFSPSPITTIPSMWIVCSTACMPSTAAWSAASLSPRPIQRALPSAAASVTRTSSSARLRSGATFTSTP